VLIASNEANRSCIDSARRFVQGRANRETVRALTGIVPQSPAKDACRTALAVDCLAGCVGDRDAVPASVSVRPALVFVIMSAPTLAGKLVVAISSRALFDLTDSHRVYTDLGVETYHRYQIEHEDELLAPGPAFALVTKLLRLNRLSKQYVEVILLSRNSADTGLRVFNAIKHYGLDITRAAFTKGEPTSRYVPAFGAHLFLSADTDDVRRALEDGYAAATIFPSVFRNETDELRIAFDGDAVLFSDEAERVYQSAGLAAFAQSERDAAAKPLSGGPFKEFLAALHRIQADFPEDQSPIRTALVTARSAPAHERVIRTLRAWNIRIDEALFLGGLEKGEFLRAFGADIFFDDQTRHVESAARHVSACHVPHGIANE
jgi:5'-nucleotidase